MGDGLLPNWQPRKICPARIDVFALIRLVFVLRNTSLSDRNGLNRIIFSTDLLERWPFVGRISESG